MENSCKTVLTKLTDHFSRISKPAHYDPCIGKHIRAILDEVGGPEAYKKLLVEFGYEKIENQKPTPFQYLGAAVLQLREKPEAHSPKNV